MITSAASFSHASTFATINCTDGVLTVEFLGSSLGERESKIVGRDLANALAAAGDTLRFVVLDMGNLEIMSSIGLGMCIDVRNAAQEHGAPTVVYRLCERLRRLFGMTRVDRLYRMVGSRTELDRMLAA